LFNHLQAKGSEPSCPDRSLCEHGLITISSQHLTENEKENNDAQLLLARRQAYNRLIPTAESHAFGQLRVADDPPRSALWQFNGLGVIRQVEMTPGFTRASDFLWPDPGETKRE